jgi:hypothetical protein
MADAAAPSGVKVPGSRLGECSRMSLESRSRPARVLDWGSGRRADCHESGPESHIAPALFSGNSRRRRACGGPARSDRLHWQAHKLPRGLSAIRPPGLRPLCEAGERNSRTGNEAWQRRALRTPRRRSSRRRIGGAPASTSAGIRATHRKRLARRRRSTAYGNEAPGPSERPRRARARSRPHPYESPRHQPTAQELAHPTAAILEEAYRQVPAFRKALRDSKALVRSTEALERRVGRLERKLGLRHCLAR